MSDCPDCGWMLNLHGCCPECGWQPGDTIPLGSEPSPYVKLPDFDGDTFMRALDHARLGKQLLAVGKVMADGEWHTLEELMRKTGYGPTSIAAISARIRDLKKEKFGGHTVVSERVPGEPGLWRYRMVLSDV